METIATILFLGAAQGFLLAFVLLSIRRGNRSANRMLAAILVIFSLCIVLHSLSYSENELFVPHHSGIVGILFFLVGPLFYFYVKALTANQPGFRKEDTLHLLPFFLGMISLIASYLQFIDRDEGHLVQEIILTLLVFQTLSYIIFVIAALRKHSRRIQETFSSIEKINLNWLRFLIIGYTLTWLISLTLEGFGGNQQSWDYGWLFVSAFMYAIRYLGLKQPEIFSGGFGENASQKSGQKKKYEKSTLTSEASDAYYQKLKAVMKTEKPFLQSDLTMPGLAKQLSISPHHLSRVINEKFQQNFFEFINRCRVEEAKQMLLDPQSQHLNIAAIGLEAGFNSISAFNAAFKKHAGMTPSQFRADSLMLDA